MIRAVFEGTAFGLRQIMNLAEAKWGLHPSKMVGVGGGSHSRFWAHIKADILDLEYGMTEFQDASAFFEARFLGKIASHLPRNTLVGYSLAHFSTQSPFSPPHSQYLLDVGLYEN